jgi:hypothetical protein
MPCNCPPLASLGRGKCQASATSPSRPTPWRVYPPGAARSSGIRRLDFQRGCLLARRRLHIARLCDSPRSGLVGACVGMATRGHRAHIKLKRLPESVDGCEDCLVAGTFWLHLRTCLECGHVACCDESPRRRAHAHTNESGHPIIRSLEPGEQWNWCYVDRIAMLARSVTGTTRIPPSPLGSRERDTRPRRPGGSRTPWRRAVSSRADTSCAPSPRGWSGEGRF